MAYNLKQLRAAMRANAAGKRGGSKPAAGTAAVKRSAGGALKVSATAAASGKSGGSKKGGSKKQSAVAKAALAAVQAAAAKAASKPKKAKAKAASKPKKAASKPKAAAKPKKRTSKAAAAPAKAAGSKKRTSKAAAPAKPAGSKKRTSKAAGSVRRVPGLSFRSQYHMYGTPSVRAMAANKRRSRGHMRPNVLVPGGKQVVQYRAGSKRGETIIVPSLSMEHSYERDFNFGGVAKTAHGQRRKGWRKNLISLLQAAEREKRAPGTSKKKAGGSKPAGQKKAAGKKAGGTKKATAVAANRRYSMKRNSKRRGSKRVSRNSKRRGSKRVSRNPLYTIMSNKRHSKHHPRKNGRGRGVRKNPLMVYGVDLLSEVVMPAGVATGGFLIANALSNAVASNEGMRNLLDRGRDADQALATKSVANGLGIVATLGVAAWGAKSGNKLIKDNATPLLTGMGLAMAARLLRGTSLAPYLGEYVEQPMSGLGETYYAAAGVGAYVNDPSAGIGDATYYATAGLGQSYAEGIDPADQSSVDGLMDVMEAAAGSPILEAAAGVGEYVEQPMNGVGEYVEQPMSGLGETFYATAGLGAEADATLQKFYQKHQPPFASIQTPTDMAAGVTKEIPFDRPIPTSLVTPEGKGYAGGLFARNLFAGMF